MAQYLNMAGVTALWGKIKGTFLPKSGGTITGTLKIFRDAAAINYCSSTGTSHGWLGFSDANVPTVWMANGSTQYNLIHTGNIGSQSVNYATSAGSVDWVGVTGKPNYYEYSTQRDFGSGTLIKTDINYNNEQGDPFYGEIKGNTYSNAHNSCFTQFQGYIYSNTIIAYGVTHLGSLHITPITAMNIDGKLCFWFPRLGYWMGFSVKVTTGYDYSINRVTSVIDSAEPSGTKKVILTSSTVYNINSQNIGSQSVNYAGSAGSASSVHWSGVTGKPSSFTPSSHTHSYLPLSGGTIDGSIAIGHADNNSWKQIGFNRLNSSGVNEQGFIGNDISSMAMGMQNGYIRVGEDLLNFMNNGSTRTILHSGNSSVSKSGETLTVTINGVSKSITNTDTNSWRPVTNTYTGSDQSTCVSQYGTNALYNALVNGYASSAGSASSVPWSGVTDKPVLPVYYNLSGSDAYSILKNNVTSFVRDRLVHAYLGHGSASFAMGWVLSGYDSSPYCAFIVNHYGDNWSLMGSSSGNWTHRTLLHSGNISSYALTSLPSHTHSYLPLSGGTVNGSITATAFYQSSDERLKTFYDPIKVDFDKLSKLRKNYFKFNDKDKLEIGVSAQEVQEIYPELVTSDDEGYLSVAYDKLSVIALAALDEQQKEIDDLKNQLSTIKDILKEKGIL